MIQAPVNITEIEAKDTGEIYFSLNIDCQNWPIHITYEALQDLARNNGHSPTDSPMSLFKAYEKEIMPVIIKSIQGQTNPQPIYINADVSPWLN